MTYSPCSNLNSAHLHSFNSAHPDPAVSRLNLLLIANHAVAIEMLHQDRSPAQRATWNITQVEQLQEAVAQLQCKIFDVIFIDLPLPDASGKEIISQLQIHTSLPMIVLTHLENEAIALEAVRQGAQDYLLKEQISPGLLVRAIRHAIERSQMQKVMRQQTAALAACQAEFSDLKSRFITTVSHEFRTPLTTILSSTELLQRYGQQWTDEKRKIRFDRIIEGVYRMTQLLEDVLIISQAEAGQLPFQPTLFDLTQFCQELINQLQANTDTGHQIRFTSQISDRLVWLDKDLLHQILINLITNAIQYSPQAYNIHIDLNGNPTEIIIRVQDSGIGIVATEHKHLFDAFYRGSNVGDISGIGLGLAIVKQCLDRHSGQIQVNSQLGQGSLFTVTLPDRPQAQEETSDSSAWNQEASKEQPRCC